MDTLKDATPPIASTLNCLIRRKEAA